MLRARSRASGYLAILLVLATLVSGTATAEDRARDLSQLLEPARGFVPPAKGRVTDALVKMPGVRRLLIRTALDPTFRRLLCQQLADGTIGDPGRALYALWALTEVDEGLDGRQYQSLIKRHPGRPVAYLALLTSPSMKNGWDSVDHRHGHDAQVAQARRWRGGELESVAEVREFRGDRQFLQLLLSSLRSRTPAGDRRSLEKLEQAISRLTPSFRGASPDTADALIEAFPGTTDPATYAILFGMDAYLDNSDLRNGVAPPETMKRATRMLSLIEKDLRSGADRGVFLLMTSMLKASGTAEQKRLAESLRIKRLGKTGWEKRPPAKIAEGKWGAPLPKRATEKREQPPVARGAKSAPARKPASVPGDSVPTANTPTGTLPRQSHNPDRSVRLPTTREVGLPVSIPVLLALAGCLLVGWLAMRGR